MLNCLTVSNTNIQNLQRIKNVKHQCGYETRFRFATRPSTASLEVETRFIASFGPSIFGPGPDRFFHTVRFVTKLSRGRRQVMKNVELKLLGDSDWRSSD
jgi:hypothetical protein